MSPDFEVSANLRFWPVLEIATFELLAENRPFGIAQRHQFKCNGHSPLVADCASTGSVPQSYRWPDAHRSCPDSVCGGAISSGLSRIASLRIMVDSQNKQTKSVYDRTHKAP